MAEERRITQTELDRIVEVRVERVRRQMLRKYPDYYEVKAAAERYDRLMDEQQEQEQHDEPSEQDAPEEVPRPSILSRIFGR